MLTRCTWAQTPLSLAYHDEEWGVPIHDERLLFEFLILEGAQAGLSWETILRKRLAYRAAFQDFDPRTVAAYTATDVERLLADPGIVRNRLKVQAAVKNARAFLELQAAEGSFDAYLSRMFPVRPRHNTWSSAAEVPARTDESDALSRDLARRGFTFVGSTICYAFMQATGIVNDHTVTCFRHAELAGHSARSR